MAISLEIQTEAGTVRGMVVGKTWQFLGVPYAAPPTGSLRWKPPAPPVPWDGVLPATVLPTPASQLRGINGPQVINEDCLYLNIYRPAGLPPEAKLPVLVWIHGGGFVDGSANQHDGGELAARTGIMVVTLNYRLNVFGFLALPALSAEAEDGTSGNYGLLDQLAALKWLKRNIAAFGGDPGCVTLAGQSAGGFSVCALLASPLASGLFQRAIIQSGGAQVGSLAEAEQMGSLFASSLGCTDPATAAVRLRKIPATKLLSASASLQAWPNASGALLPMPPDDAIATGAYQRLPVLIGQNHDEMQADILDMPYPITPEAYEGYLWEKFGDHAGQVFEEYPLSHYPDPADALQAVMTDSLAPLGRHFLNSYRLAELFSATTSTYVYEFNDPHAPPQRELPSGFSTGAYHTAEVQYLFRFPVVRAKTPRQERLSVEMMRYWAAFARTGEPKVPGQAQWPRFNPHTHRVLSLQPGGSRVITNFAVEHHVRFWENLPRNN
jgi:para-nitrobenzyl esterase